MYLRKQTQKRSPSTGHCSQSLWCRGNKRLRSQRHQVVCVRAHTPSKEPSGPQMRPEILHCRSSRTLSEPGVEKDQQNQQELHVLGTAWKYPLLASSSTETQGCSGRRKARGRMLGATSTSSSSFSSSSYLTSPTWNAPCPASPPSPPPSPSPSAWSPPFPPTSATRHGGTEPLRNRGPRH